MTKRRGSIIGAALVALTVVAAVSVLPGRPIGGDHNRPSASPTASDAAPSSDPGGAPPPTTASFVDGPFGSTLTHEPTAGEAQARLWFNDGSWWGTLVDPTTQQLRLARLDWPSQRWIDTGTLVDERLRVRSDALWDGTHLTIVSARGKPTKANAARIVRFHYDAKARTYVIDPDFPITVTPTGVDDPVVVRDSTGTLWLSYRDQETLVVRHTVGDDFHWTPRAGLKVDGADGLIRTVALVADGKRVALAWNRPNEAELRIAFHADGAADGLWTTAVTLVDGLRNATGGMSVRSVQSAGGARLFIAFDTAYDVALKTSPLSPGAVVMVLEPDGSWVNVQLARVKDHLTAPILAIDSRQGVVYAIAAAANTGEIVVKRSPIDQVSFESGRGDSLISSAGDTAIRNPTTSKQDVDAASGLVVLGADDGSGHYLHGVLVTGGALPMQGPAPKPPAPVVNTLIHDTFDPWAVGTIAPSGWAATSQGGGVGTLKVVALPSATNHGLEVVPTSALGSVRACRSFPAVDSGIVTVSQLVRITAVGGSDATIASVRGPGGEAVSVRVTRHDLIAYLNGGKKIVTTRTFRPGVWYRLNLTVRAASHTYDWALTTASGAAVARATGVHWRSPTPALDTFCIQTAQGSRGAGFLIDDVVVRH